MIPRSSQDHWQNQSLKNHTGDQSFKAGKGSKEIMTCGSRFTLQGEGTEESHSSLLLLVCSESILGSSGDKGVDNGSGNSGCSGSL